MTDTNANDAEIFEAIRKWSCYAASPARSLELFGAVRGKCPVVHSDVYDGFNIVLRYDDVLKAEKNHEAFSTQPSAFRPSVPRKPVPALEMDPPEHGHWRAVFNAAVNARTPGRMEALVRYNVRRHIEDFVERGECDIAAELSKYIPAETICNLVGIEDAETIARIQETATAMFAAQGAPETFAKRQDEFAAVAVPEITKRRVEPRDDFLTYLANLEVDGRKLDEDDYVVLLGAFLGAGHHTTTSAMTALIYEVFSRPELRDRLIKEPEKIKAAVEEALRLHPPFFGFFRRAKTAVDIGNMPIAANSDVYLCWAAANRDPEIFERPEAFDVDRPGLLRHLAFGAGIHTCPGAPLARMQLRVALEELLARVPDLSVDVATPDYEFSAGEGQHLAALPVRFTPRQRRGNLPAIE